MTKESSTIWFETLGQSAPISELVSLLKQGGEASVRGAVGSSTHLVAATLQHQLACPVLLVTAHLDDADEAIEEYESLGIEVMKFPAMVLSPGEKTVSLDVLAERLTYHDFW